MLHKLVIIVAIIPYLALAQVPSQPSPRADFESDSLITAAKAEIGLMAPEQLAAVMEYLAACTPPPSPERDFTCERASLMASMKTSNRRYFHRIRQALVVADKLIPWSKSGLTDREVRMLERRVELFGQLREAAAERFAEASLR
jgi:hypothetical protein